MTSLKADVIVVGAGPVGLLATLSAAKNGNSVILLEKNETRPRQSRAIGITPPTLGIFQRLGILDGFLSCGIKVNRAAGYTISRKLCDVAFTGLDTDFPFILAIPQDRTEALLESAISAQPKVTFLKGVEGKSLDCSKATCTVIGADKATRRMQAQGHYVFGCDGAQSVIRNTMESRFIGKPYSHTFLMADYEDVTGWGDEARLYFTARGSVESFPLPAGKRRFVLRTPFFVKENPSEFLAAELPRRCGVSTGAIKPEWESAFGVQHFIASSFAASRVFLCGDAAHIMSPIGGQNMNVGFADAELAAWFVSIMHTGNKRPEAVAVLYNHIRRKAAQAATLRAELMMRAGTSGGTVWNSLRGYTMGIALRTPLASVMNRMFTMLSLPNRDLPSCIPRIERSLGCGEKYFSS